MTVSGTATFNDLKAAHQRGLVHRRKLSLQVQDRGFHSPCGSSFPRSFTNTDHGYAVLPQDAADIHEVEVDQPLNHQQIRD
jgi:hypothetical protein